MDSDMHIGMVVCAVMIFLMLLPTVCCRVSQDEYDRIIKRY
jgi:hypothetical protein